MGRTLLCSCMAMLAFLGLTPSVANSASLLDRLIPFKRFESDPSTDYGLTEKHGPWMILATTFSGEGAEQQAQELVLELRGQFGMEAYTHKMAFDFTQTVSGLGLDRFGDPKRMRYQRDQEIQEIGVLVGNFQSVEKPRIQRALKKIKYARPAALDRKSRKTTSQSLAALRTIQSALLPDGDARRKKGPMGHAFITRNPILPREFFVPKGVDKAVAQMNKGLPNSLLECPGEYTVRVATFKGGSTFQTASLARHASKPKSRRSISRLERAARNANTLAARLREKGIEAYEFHDRKQSIVTIGSFDSLGSRLPNGRFRYNPQILAVIDRYRARPEGSPAEDHRIRDIKRKEDALRQTFHSLGGAQIASNTSQSNLRPFNLWGVPIPFDLQPQAMSVPKRSVSSFLTGL